jgi:catechol 2,3-dioxygenase-like lactoylglutathione lyase family enzyme
MLANCPVYPTLPASDLQRARRFYAEKLGLTSESEGPEGLRYRCGEHTQFLLFPTQGMASGTHTQLAWVTPNIEAEVAELKARGLVFEEYERPSLKTVNSIATTGPFKGAWFKDSEGNLLNLGSAHPNLKIVR